MARRALVIDVLGAIALRESFGVCAAARLADPAAGAFG
jgi:hypothetical protein